MREQHQCVGRVEGKECQLEDTLDENDGNRSRKDSSKNRNSRALSALKEYIGCQGVHSRFRAKTRARRSQGHK